MSLRTIEVGADVEAVGLARGDSLRKTEERRSEGPDALSVEDLGRVHRGARAGDLDAEAIPWKGEHTGRTSETTKLTWKSRPSQTHERSS